MPDDLEAAARRAINTLTLLVGVLELAADRDPLPPELRDLVESVTPAAGDAAEDVRRLLRAAQSRGGHNGDGRGGSQQG